MTAKELEEFIEDYGYIANTTFTVPVDRDRLKDLVLTCKRLLAKNRENPNV